MTKIRKKHRGTPSRKSQDPMGFSADFLIERMVYSCGTGNVMANLWNNLPRCGGLKEDGYLGMSQDLLINIF